MDQLLKAIDAAIADHDARRRWALMQQLRKAVEPSEPENLYRALGELTGRTYGQVAGDLYRARKAENTAAPAAGGAAGAAENEQPEVYQTGHARAIFRIESEVYRGGLPARTVSSFTGAWTLTGDFLILNDVHIPATNWDFADLALRVAESHLLRPRRCIIAGDLINGDALSRWDDLVLCTPLADELEYANAWLNHLAGYFDEIYLLRGNHENRLLLSLKGQLHAEQFRRMVADNDRIHFSMYAYANIVSGGQRWYIAHQRNYSQLPLSVARRMASKMKSNVICAHQHHTASGRDVSNTFTLVDSGGLHDHALMAYVQLDASTAPVMANGFVLLRDGIATVFTPRDYGLVEWDMWLQGAPVA